MFRTSTASLQLNRRRRPTLQGLESRCVLTTSIVQSGSALFIAGDASNQNITVTQTGAGQYRVQAADLAGGAKTYGSVGYISIITKSGTDVVTLVGNGGAALANGIEVRGSGNLTVNNKQFNISVSGGGFTVRDTDAKSIRVNVDPGTVLGKHFKVNAGTGNDIVNLPAGCYVKGLVNLSLGSGTNSVTIGKSTIDGTLQIVGTTGSDLVTLAGTTAGYFNTGSLVLNLGGGANNIAIQGVTINGNSNIQCNSGSTVMSISNAKLNGNVNYVGGALASTVTNSKTVGKLQFVTYAGNDDIRVTNCQIGEMFVAHTNKGVDAVRLENVTIATKCEAVASGQAQFTSMNSTVLGPLVVNFAQSTVPVSVRFQGGAAKSNTTISTGAGNDSIYLLGTTIGQTTGSNVATVLPGGGNDLLDVSWTIFSSSRAHFDGYTGSNEYRHAGTIFVRTQPIVQRFGS